MTITSTTPVAIVYFVMYCGDGCCASVCWGGWGGGKGEVHGRIFITIISEIMTG